MINGLDLFSGIGGISLGLREWVRPVAYCEIEPYSRAVLLTRMHAGDLPTAPIWDDVRTLNRDVLDAAGIGTIDIVYGGFPCQDISTAGAGAGLDGKHSGLFFEIVRIIGELRPRFVFLENVSAILSRGADRVLGEMASLGYDCRWAIVSAAAVGAPHIRKRWWCLAHADCKRCDCVDGCKRSGSPISVCQVGNGHTDRRSGNENVADADRIRCGHITEGHTALPKSGRSGTPVATGVGGWWAVEPDVGRVADGIPKRVDRIRSLGNAVVPQSAEKAFRILSGIEGGVA